MQQLRFVELDESGHLVLQDDDGTRYAVSVDDRLRAALRPRRAASDSEHGEPAATPREVQAMIRAGQTAEEVATATGWDLARVHRFEGPILAEREHVVGLAKAAHVRAHGRTDGSHTLERRVRERLQTRGVPPAEVAWDAARSEHTGPWTVLVIFTAGGRERRAAWHYDQQARSIDALDDEARWLSEDEQALPGGLAGHPLLGQSSAEDESHDLMATMRERRQRRTRRPRKAVEPVEPVETGDKDGELPEAEESADAPEAAGRTKADRAKGGDAKQGPGAKGSGRSGPAMVDEVLPLEDLAFDPATMGDPPAAHPRGSAAESPAPVGVSDEDEHGEERDEEHSAVDESSGAQPTARQQRAPKPPRQRRRLRMPKLPTPVGGHDEDEDQGGEPEGTYARTRHDPYEVSFDEFFGTDEEDEDEGEDLVEVDTEQDADEDEISYGQVHYRGDDDDVEDVDGDEVADVDDPGEAAASADEGEPAAEDDASGDELTAEDDSSDEDEPGAAPSAEDGPAVDDDEEQDEEKADEKSEPEADETVSGSDTAASDETGTGEPEPAPAKRKGRTSVPSWDDIMFGAGDRRR